MGDEVFRLLELPTEIVIEILENLSLQPLLQVSVCCTLLHNVINETVSLQLTVALGATGTSEPPGLPRSTARERLEELKRREHSWLRLRFTDCGSVPLSPESRVYELQHGVFVQGIRSTVSPALSTGVRVAVLPTLSGGAALAARRPRTLKYSLGFSFADFNIDPSQDLVVYACYEYTLPEEGSDFVHTYIRLRRLSHKGAPHPHARFERLELGPTSGRSLSWFVQIFGDFVGVLTRAYPAIPTTLGHYETTLSIYNWKTGDLQVRLRKDYVENFIFLSPYYFMLISNNNPTGISVYQMQPRRTVGVSPPLPKPPRLVATFSMPEIRHGATGLSEIDCRCEPTPVFEPPDYVVEGAESSEKEVPGVDKGHFDPSVEVKPFPPNTPRPIVRPGQYDFRIAVLSFKTRREALMEKFICFVAISELFQMARRVPEAVRLDSPWKTWAPNRTRVMEGPLSAAWVCYVYMNRFAFLAREAPFDAPFDDAEEMDLRHRYYAGILDFNPRAMDEQYLARTERWATPGMPEHEDDDKWPPGHGFAAKGFDHVEASPLGEEMFTEPLLTSLRCRRYVSYRALRNVSDIMIDGERILILEEDEDSGEGFPETMRILAL